MGAPRQIHKGVLVSVLEKFIDDKTNQDLPLIESLLHENISFVQDTTMETQEDLIKDIKDQFANGNFDATKMEITEKFITEDMGVLEVILNEYGRSIRFSNVYLIKDNKIYRPLIHAVDV